MGNEMTESRLRTCPLELGPKHRRLCEVGRMPDGRGGGGPEWAVALGHDSRLGPIMDR